MTARQRAPGWLSKPFTKVYSSVLSLLPEWSFITIHYTYFIGTCMISSIILWVAATPFGSLRYVDALFLAVSAMTLAGLNTVNLSELNTFQQFWLFLLIMLGSAILVSTAVVHVRKRAFERKLGGIVEEKQKSRRLSRRTSFRLPVSLTKRRLSESSARGTPSHDAAGGPLKHAESELIVEPEPSKISTDPAPVPSSQVPPAHTSNDDPELGKTTAPDFDTRQENEELSSHIRFEPLPSQHLVQRQGRRRVFSGAGVGVTDLRRHPRNASQTRLPLQVSSGERTGRGSLNKYLDTVNGLIGRNSQFHNLTSAEREELGGLEYQAVSLLGWVVPAYFIAWQLLGCLGCGAWIYINRPTTATKNGLDPFWAGAFLAVSAFNNSGMALLDANMTAFQTSYYLLLTMGLLILAGNTCYPPFLRLILWTMKKMMPGTARWEERRKVLTFILDHPRRVYTNLFPSRETWFLVGSLVVLNGIDWFAFGVLDIGNKALDSIPVKFRVLDGLFQAFAIRSGGFYVFAIPSLRPGLLVLYVLMMYISVYPVTMTMRSTNTYEERSLGVYAEDCDINGDNAAEGGRRRSIWKIFGHGGSNASHPSSYYFIRQQLHGQLAHDLWWLAFAVLFITIVETDQFDRNPVVFSTFNIIFEVVSAYGCVGVSTGVPWNNYSFCGAWHTTSKLILCAVMLRGRHRGLPVSIDKAILLPDKTLAWAEEEDAALRLDRVLSRQRTGIKSA